jgi:translation initiation factor IF-2
MIAIVSISAITLALLQASITGPTDTFRGCLREAASKAQGDKVGGDKIEDYLKTACTTQMSALTTAIVAFRVKNGMTKKAAADDAAMTVDDYVSTPADNYKFMINYNAAPAQQAAAPAAAAAPKPASAPATTSPHS